MLIFCLCPDKIEWCCFCLIHPVGEVKIVPVQASGTKRKQEAASDLASAWPGHCSDHVPAPSASVATSKSRRTVGQMGSGSWSC